MSFYSQYRGKSMGRMCHYIQEYCGLHFAELVMYGEKEITFHGESFATVEWRDTEFKGIQVPWFHVFGKYEPFSAGQQSKHDEVVAPDISRELGAKLDEAYILFERIQKCGEMRSADDEFRFRCIKGDIDRFMKE